MIDWLEILDGQTERHIARACLDHLRECPRARPTPGDIYRRVMELRAHEAKRTAASNRVTLPSPPPRNAVTAERANEIVRAAGFKLRAVKPSAQGSV